VTLPQRGVYEVKEIARGFVDGPGGRSLEMGLAVQNFIPRGGTRETESPPELAVTLGDRTFVIDVTDLLERIAHEYHRGEDPETMRPRLL
jgi:hypothetical protein